MNFLVSLIRSPIGLIGVLIVLIFFMTAFIFEFIAICIIFPFAAIFSNINKMRNGWFGKFPITIKKMNKSILNIWKWIAW